MTVYHVMRDIISARVNGYVKTAKEAVVSEAGVASLYAVLITLAGWTSVALLMLSIAAKLALA